MDVELEMLDGENAVLRRDLEMSRKARNELIRANRALADACKRKDAHIARLEEELKCLRTSTTIV